MKTAIVGAGRNKNGIGQYIGKYFQKSGAEVVAVLGTSLPSARQAASALTQYGINAAAYIDFHEMVKNKRPQAVVIASPVSTHYDYLLKCVDADVHVFCEKPFVRPDDAGADINARLEKIFTKAKRRSLIIGMNSQWPFSLPFYETLCGPVSRQEASSFFIRLSPMASGKEMIPESVPHALSLLYEVYGSGDMENLSIEKNNKTTRLTFGYRFSDGRCKSRIDLVQTLRQPREFSYGFGHKIVQRRLDLNNYDIFFTYSDKTIKITDPLALSVQDFLSAVQTGRSPLIGENHIVNNMVLLKTIYEKAV